MALGPFLRMSLPVGVFDFATHVTPGLHVLLKNGVVIMHTDVPTASSGLVAGVVVFRFRPAYPAHRIKSCAGMFQKWIKNLGILLQHYKRSTSSHPIPTHPALEKLTPTLSRLISARWQVQNVHSYSQSTQLMRTL